MSIQDALSAIVGAANVLTGETAAPFLVDWRGRYKGQAQAVVRPGNTEEVAAVVRHCLQHSIPIVPQATQAPVVVVQPAATTAPVAATPVTSAPVAAAPAGGAPMATGAPSATAPVEAAASRQ